MPQHNVRILVKWIICSTIAGCAFANQQSSNRLDAPLDSPQFKRLYIEPLNVKMGSEKFRRNMIAQLRKLNSISLVSSRESADAVLTANGEIWVKGYVSLNPRSGRAPSSGTPVYTGFLSVEIKDARGVTLWSYLVKAGSESQDISKDLSKRIAKHLAAALDGEHPASIQRR